MSDHDADRALQVRVAGHRRLRVLLGAVENRRAERADCRVRLRARVAHVQAQRRRDLVVARTARMDLPTDLPELPLDRRVHVFILGRERIDLGEQHLDFGELVRREDAHRREPLRMLQRRRTVVGQKLRIVGAEELPHLDRRLPADAAGPQRHGFPPRCVAGDPRRSARGNLSVPPRPPPRRMSRLMRRVRPFARARPPAQPPSRRS